MTQRIRAALPLAVAACLLLASCAGEPSETASPTPTETAAPEPTEAPPVAEAVFTLPGDCTGLLPAARQQALQSDGRILLGGPGGKYPGFYADPTPEEQAGGISCVWGDEADPKTTVTVSAAPLSGSTRGTVVESLIAQGLNEAIIDEGISYAQIGDENSAPAVLNVLRDDSWISVIAAGGGELVFNEAVELADEAAQQVYIRG